MIIGILIWLFLKEVSPAALRGTTGGMNWKDVPRIFAYRNCTVSFVANVLIMVGFWGVVTFGTTYWASEGGLTLEKVGYMTSISGFAGLGWALVIPIIEPASVVSPRRLYSRSI